MKKLYIILFICMFFVIALSEVSSSTEAKKTYNKTIIKNVPVTIQSPVLNKKIKSVKVSKKYKSYVSIKKSKKSFVVTGKRMCPRGVSVKVKVGKKNYTYLIKVVVPSTTTTSTDSSTPTTPTVKPDTNVKPYHNNGTNCSCGGAWEEIIATDTYKPSCWYLGCIESCDDDVEQTWKKEPWYEGEDTYYPLRVQAVEDDYDYDYISKPLPSGLPNPITLYFAIGKTDIPTQIDGKPLSAVGGSRQTADGKWVEERGGQVAKMSVDNYQKTATVKTGFYKCKKCGKVKQ